MHDSQHVAIKLEHGANPPSSMPFLAWKHSQNLWWMDSMKLGDIKGTKRKQIEAEAMETLHL